MKWSVSFLVFCATLVGCGGSPTETAGTDPSQMEDGASDAIVGSNSSSSGGTPDTGVTQHQDSGHTQDAHTTPDAESDSSKPGIDSGHPDSGQVDAGLDAGQTMEDSGQPDSGSGGHDAAPEVSQPGPDAGSDADPAPDSGERDAVAESSPPDSGPDSVGPVCTPGATQCSGTEIETCGSNGQWGAAAPCAAVACQTGACSASTGQCAYSNMSDNTVCDIVSRGQGTCHSGSCCTGCWNTAAGACETGNSPFACGQAGQSCHGCEDACVPGTMVSGKTCNAGGFYGAQISSCYTNVGSALVPGSACGSGVCVAGSYEGLGVSCGATGQTCHPTGSSTSCN